MALTYDQVSGLTHQIISESSADNIYDSNPLMLHLKEKGSVMEDGGIHIQLPITHKKLGAGGSFNKYDVLDTTPTDSETAAKWLWKWYYVNSIVSKTELLTNEGKSQAVNLVKAKVKNAQAKMRDLVGSGIYSTDGDSATGVNGLRLTVSSSGTAGGIATSDFSGWAGKISTSTVLALSTLESALLQPSIGSDEPDIMVCTKPIFKKFWALLQANQRFGAEEVAKGGFKYLLFNYVPVFHDAHVPSKHLFLLNSRWLYFYVHRNANMVMEKIGPVANQAVHVDRLLLGCNLATDNRRMHFKYSLLNYT